MSRRTVVAFVLAALLVVLPGARPGVDDRRDVLPDELTARRHRSTGAAAARHRRPGHDRHRPRRRSAPTASPSPPPARPRRSSPLIAAGNAIASLPYKYGGGHQSFEDTRL